ncbi:energy transducer TonB [Qipengyuania oceanensis]|uniref:Energy transducer TonB n=1 Tax=Qipengyuania oceanensis TaxID=1463597 RepID=A0A844YKY6_9SPHN|nr:energy transducer TonB [Qipengyuania oceanensis]MXO64049.1 energy transducer TonB [Qipengyuania oceanensis]
MALASPRTEGFRKEERAGLAVAVVLHVALVAALLFQPEAPPAPVPERMTVNLAEDVGLEAQAPVPVLESRASTSPELTDTISPEPPLPEVVERPVETRPEPAPVATAKPRAKPTPRKETPRETARETRREAPRPKPKADAGGSKRFDQAFAGAGSSENTTETRVPASEIGASAKASLSQAVARQIKPHWSPPDGPEVEKITTYVRFRLNENGSLAGRPEMVRQTGVNDVNRAQAGRHAEQAIRAVQLAAPFDLPGEYYNAWKTVTANLDWKLAQ